MAGFVGDTTPAEGYTLDDAHDDLATLSEFAIKYGFKVQVTLAATENLHTFLTALDAEAQSLRERVETAEKALLLSCQEHARQSDCTMLPDEQRIHLYDYMKRDGFTEHAVDIPAVEFVSYFQARAAALKATQTEEG